MSSILHTELLTETELALVSGGYIDWEDDWCGTGPKPFPIQTGPGVDPWRSMGGRFSAVALNPQPLPPQEIGGIGTKTIG